MKLSTAQQALIHTAISLGVSALLTIAGLAYQFFLGHGLDFPALLRFIGPVFIGQLSLIFLSLKNNPNLGQAELDTLNEALQGLHDKIDGLLPFLHSHPVAAPTPAPAASLPSINITPPGTAIQPPYTITTSSAAQSAPVPQLPFPTPAPAMLTTLNTPTVKP